MAGLGVSGLSIKRLSDIRTEITDRLKAFFGAGINTSEDSIFGQVRDSVAPGEASLWELLQEVYDSQTPSRAEGQQLDDNCALVGVFRKGFSSSTAIVEVTASEGTVLPVRFDVAVNTTGDIFTTEVEKIVSSLAATQVLTKVVVISDSTEYIANINGVDASYTSDASATVEEIVAGLIDAINALSVGVTATVAPEPDNYIVLANTTNVPFALIVDTNQSFQAVTSPIEMSSLEKGEIPAPAKQIEDIKTFVSGVLTARNLLEGSLGSTRETDAELRVRRNITLGVVGSSSVQAIYTRLLLVEGVRSTTVLENYGDAVDGDGLAPHSIKAIVEGGADQDVAQAIFDTKPVGTGLNGTESVPIEDSQGFSWDILFERPTVITIYIEITLTRFSNYPSEGDDTIKNNLVEYGVENLFAGDDVITSRLYTPINEVSGQQVDSLFIGTSPSPISGATIPISTLELADIEYANITVI